MNAIKILNKYSQNKSIIKIDYEFNEIIDIIKDKINDNYWYLQQVIYPYKAKDGSTCKELSDKNRSMFIFDETDKQIAPPEFLIKYSKHIKGDWSSILGFKDKNIATQTKSANINALRKCDIAFICIDAAFWFVLANDKSIIDKIKDNGFNCEEKDFEELIQKHQIY